MKVFITRKIPEEGISLLKNMFEVELHDSDEPISYESLLKGVKDASGLFCLLSDRIDKRIIESASKLKVIANYAAGYNNIDIETASLKGIYVTNTPDVLTETTADLAWALILSVARKIVESDQFLRSGKFKGWGPKLLLGNDVFGKTLGILGMGKIGTAVAKRGTGFSMDIIYHSPNRKLDSEKSTGAKYVPFDEFISRSDFLSLNLPLTKNSEHIISTNEFDKMKPSAFLINTARGPIVDEKALVSALKVGKIKGAGLDVFEFEPKIERELLSMKNVVLLPHIGSASEYTREKMSQISAESIIEVLTGKIPANCVNTGLLK